MRKLLLFVLLVSVFTACYQAGGEIAFQPPSPDKWPTDPGANSIKVSLYVDTANFAKDPEKVKAALQAVGSYSIKPVSNEWRVAYFDYVVISGGEMRYGRVSPYLTLSDDLVALLKEHDTVLQPLRARGIKILLGVAGVHDGVAMGSMPRDEEKKNQGSIAQEGFARYVSNIAWYYRLDGVEFWDKDGEKAGEERSPYPTPGRPFFNGAETIPAFDDQGFPRPNDTYWKKGGGYMVDMMAFVIEMFGARGTPAGDLPFDQKIRTPIMLRDVGFGSWIPDMVPRYEFATSMAVISYLINPDKDSFGYNDTGKATNEVMAGWIDKNYSPIILDLPAISDAKLKEYSERISNGGNPRYYIVYYEGLRSLEDPDQLRKLNITAREIFGADVEVD